jgi:hypothetical protein
VAPGRVQQEARRHEVVELQLLASNTGWSTTAGSATTLAFCGRLVLTWITEILPWN